MPKLLGDYPSTPGKTLIDDGNFQQVCLYLLSCGTYLADPDDLKQVQQCAFRLYERHNNLSAALGVALQIGDDADADFTFADRCKGLLDRSDGLMRKQIAFVLARQKSSFEYIDDDIIDGIIGNNRLGSYYVRISILNFPILFGIIG